MQVTVDFKDLLNVRGRLRNVIMGMPAEVRKVNTRTASRVKAALMTAASGPPGPNVVSGAYRAAMTAEVDSDELGFTAGNPSPQAHRLEFGFVGRDRLGRHYAQAPRPHFRPVLDHETPIYMRDLQDEIGRLLK